MDFLRINVCWFGVILTSNGNAAKITCGTSVTLDQIGSRIQLHGKSTTYNRSGKLESELEYKENQKHGDSKIYDKKNN